MGAAKRHAVALSPQSRYTAILRTVAERLTPAKECTSTLAPGRSSVSLIVSQGRCSSMLLSIRSVRATCSCSCNAPNPGRQLDSAAVDVFAITVAHANDHSQLHLSLCLYADPCIANHGQKTVREDVRGGKRTHHYYRLPNESSKRHRAELNPRVDRYDVRETLLLRVTQSLQIPQVEPCASRQKRRSSTLISLQVSAA